MGRNVDPKGLGWVGFARSIDGHSGSLGHRSGRRSLQAAAWPMGWTPRSRVVWEIGGGIVPIAMPIQTDWVQSVLFDRGYLARIRGEAIKVYLVMLEACGGRPDQSVTISLSQLTKRTHLSSPTVIESLTRLGDLGLVVSTTHERGKVKTYYIADPPEPAGLSA